MVTSHIAKTFRRIAFALPIVATLLFMLVCCPDTITAQESTNQVNLHDVPSDLVVPKATEGDPAPGRRVKQKHPGFEDWELFHVLYLPPDWEPGTLYPVIVEYPGNGNYRNAYGDVSTGRVEDCKLGYGISGGRGFIWVSLPFVDPEQRKHALTWWGDPDATAAYCRQTVDRICREYGGDRQAVILTGFSRGAIACGYIGLRDDETASLWRAMIPHSHYDGARRWGYPDDDAASARERLRRFAGKPQFITHETSVADTQAFLSDINTGNIELLALPYPNHSDTWVLKDIPARKRLREWLADVLAE